MATAGFDSQRRPDIPFFFSPRGRVFYSPRNPHYRKPRVPSPPSFPTPHISPRQRRPQSVNIVSYPPGFIPPPDARFPPVLAAPRQNEKRRKKEERKSRKKAERARERIGAAASGRKKRNTILEKLLALFSTSRCSGTSTAGDPNLRPATSIGSSRSPCRTWASQSRRASLQGPGRHPEVPSHDESMARPSTMVDALRPSFVNASIRASAVHRNSVSSTRSAKMLMSSSVTELSKPVASGSGLSCSILLAEPTVFLAGFDHDGHTRHQSHNSTALLRGKLQLNVSKNVKLKSVTLKLVGKARTEWPEGIPPLKVDLFEEESLRTQVLTFFHAMHDGWETEYGNQCTFNLKGNSANSSTTNLNQISGLSPSQSAISLHLNNKARAGLSAKELKRLSIQSVQSRSFGKGDSPLANSVQAKGYKVFYPGKYEYSFELPIDHHQLETTKLQYGSVKWELQTAIERAGAFKPNLRGAKEVMIVRVPDQLSLEMTEPISISRQWEDQLHYDIMISGKSFPIGTKIPIAFKLTPLAKVQVHKLKVFVTESIEYWTNDRRVTRKDPGRKILLLEKAAGRPLEKQYEASDVRVLSGGELSPEERTEARSAAARRRTMEAARTSGIPQPLPEPSENLLGDLDLGLESYWGSTEIEMNVQLPTCDMMSKDKLLRLNPDCSWKNVNVYHWIKIVMRISRVDPEDPAGQRRRHFEISIDSPFTVLNCRATHANTSLPRYSGPDRLDCLQHQQTSCGCPDAGLVHGRSSPTSSTATLPIIEAGGRETPSPTRAVNAVSSSALPVLPQAAHVHTVIRQSTASPAPGSSNNSNASSSAPERIISMSPVQRLRDQDAVSSRPQSMVLGGEQFENPRPIHLMRVPSYNPPAFDAEEPPPALAQEVLTPPPNYDLIVGTPSVDGLADYFQRLADYEDPDGTGGSCPRMHGAAVGEAVEDDSDSADEGGPARILERSGRVNVANPRTPGGRLVPSRSLEIERPVLALSLSGIVRRGGE